MALILVLLLIAVICGAVGLLVHGLIWLFIIGVVLAVVSLVFGGFRTGRSHRPDSQRQDAGLRYDRPVATLRRLTSNRPSDPPTPTGAEAAEHQTDHRQNHPDDEQPDQPVHEQADGSTDDRDQEQDKDQRHAAASTPVIGGLRRTGLP